MPLCTLRTCSSACRVGTHCTPRSLVSACHGGRGCTPHSCLAVCREGKGCTPHRSVSACHEGRRCTPALQAVVFHPFVRAGLAVRAEAFRLAVRAGVAPHAAVFHLAVRTRVTLLTQRFLPSVGVPLVSHRSRATIPARTRFCAHRKRRGRCCSFEVTFVSDEQVQNRRALASSTQFQSKQQYLKSPNLRTIRTRARS